jgi:cytochrome c biogenesis protein CcmG/thiol:disulfide interchange protein DsbE
MRRYILPASVVVAAVALLALLVFGVAGQGPDTSIDAAVARGALPPAPGGHDALPVLSLQDGQLGQGTKRLADFRGKVVVLNVFASWCEPCKAEAPVLERAARRIAGQNATVLGVTYRDTSPDAAKFVREQHVSYPVVRDVSGDFVRGFGSTGVPETFVIDRQGRVAALRRYQIDSGWLDRTLAPLLPQS